MIRVRDCDARVQMVVAFSTSMVVPRPALEIAILNFAMSLRAMADGSSAAPAAMFFADKGGCHHCGATLLRRAQVPLTAGECQRDGRATASLIPPVDTSGEYGADLAAAV